MLVQRKRCARVKGVNVEDVYAAGLPGTERTLGVFRVSDIHTALKLEYPDD